MAHVPIASNAACDLYNWEYPGLHVTIHGDEESVLPFAACACTSNPSMPSMMTLRRTCLTKVRAGDNLEQCMSCFIAAL